MQLKLTFNVAIKATVLTDDWFKWLEANLTVEYDCSLSVDFSPRDKVILVRNPIFTTLYLYYITQVCNIWPDAQEWR